MRRRVVLLRHGEVSYFPTPGKGLDPRSVELTEGGLRQAQATGELLREVPFDLVVTSGLPRTRQTAEVVLSGRDVAYREDPGLEEIDPGFDKLPALIAEGDAEELFTGAFARAADPEAPFLGGETFRSLQTRVLAAWRRLLDARDWQCALVVAHGGVNRALLAHALGAPSSAYGCLEQDAACVNIIDVDQREDGSERHIVRLVNHTPYAPDKRRFVLTTLERLFRKFSGREPKL